MTPERLEKLDRVLSRRQPDLTVLAVELYKPRNLAAIMRTCDAVGIHRLNVVPGENPPRRHWHTSSGTVKWIEMRLHDRLQTATDRLRSEGFRIVAAHLSDRAVDFREVDYTVPTAIMLGTELFGVGEDALRYADEQIMIPMEGMTQSLNVSVACALVLYEAQRQRAAAGLYDEARLDRETLQRLRFEWLHPKVARFCRDKGADYPALNAAGEITGAVPRG